MDSERKSEVDGEPSNDTAVCSVHQSLKKFILTRHMKQHEEKPLVKITTL